VRPPLPVNWGSTLFAPAGATTASTAGAHALAAGGCWALTATTTAMATRTLNPTETDERLTSTIILQV